MARYGAAERRRLLKDAGIVRNRLKIDAFIDERPGLSGDCATGPAHFDAYIWKFTDGRVLRRRPLDPLSAIATATPLSEAMSKDLKRRGFRFVGSTICYAFMQAVGIVDEHQRNCWVTKRADMSTRAGAHRC